VNETWRAVAVIALVAVAITVAGWIASRAFPTRPQIITLHVDPITVHIDH
jgi:hypothetical protein